MKKCVGSPTKHPMCQYNIKKFCTHIKQCFLTFIMTVFVRIMLPQDIFLVLFTRRYS